MAENAEAIKSVPEMLKQGLEIYKTLREDMQRVLGLKQYAAHLSHIILLLKEVNQHLDSEEKELATKLDEAYSLSEKGMDKAYAVVSQIKAQSSILASILSSTGTGMSEQEKLWQACRMFSAFAKDVEDKVKEAVDALREASEKLFSRQTNLDSIVHTLKRVHDSFITEAKAAKAKQRSESYKGAAIGALWGPVGLAVSYSIAAAITEGMKIPDIEKDFKDERKKINKYINEFKDMRSETKELSDKVGGKRKMLLKIAGQLNAAGSLSGYISQSLEVHLIPILQTRAEELVVACDEFLDANNY